ncbi:unnamed protein product [Peronospora farinosa]|uniref:Integrase catalytic domain-containing protein n=1 Tax=Peronospora farinosa TaxID=134698 RepID=A0AAV0UKS6_9STRA|nr:unnamed protein product [Peronospora farinosa]
MYENQWGERIKCLRSDNGTEFVNKVMDEICQRNGIVRQKTVPYSPQQYGVAERMNRTIIKKARSMVHCKGLSSSWWEETISTAVYFINRTTNSTHTDATPYAIGFKMKPRLDHLRVFRSMGYAHVEDAKRTKIELKSFKCMFLGYGDNTKGYRVYDLEPNKVKMSRSVKVDEREDEPMESTAYPFEDVEMQEDGHEPMSSERELTTYHRNGLIMADENTMDSEDDPDNDNPFYSPSPKRPRIDKDNLLAEAVLAYAAHIDDADNAPTT